ncbi:unnamed protein product [Rhizoctonia solani]|uniref:F-box domain-containing protein n=1 Tax=Rhizoctonia solani TaxID=456999 RepID=A0A8H2WDP7_9AGAM|nr:unnamed protein product [Rhizoctonia solani]
MIASTSINSLPPEILIRIFHTVLAYPCNHCPCFPYRKQDYPRYPDYLAQVCTLWRRTAISAQTLWRHIDLSPNVPCSDRLITRAESHLARAGQLPIDIHISVNAIGAPALEYDKLYQLISLVSTRVESLEMDIAGPFQDFHRGVFKLLLCQHPSLTRLVLRPQAYHRNSFLVANSFPSTEAQRYSGPQQLDLTEEEIEILFAPLTILHSHGIFPLWSSRAYHGLVDLRLLSTDQWSDIRERDLITVLKSSPELKTLHFHLDIHDSTPTTEKLIPVTLRDLHVVKIFTSTIGAPSLCPSPSKLLRLLAPGTKPLRLSFEDFYTKDDMFTTELEGFFARSNVAMFYTRTIFPSLDLLLRHSNNLEQVVLDYFNYYFCTQTPAAEIEVDGFASLPRLKSLHITRSVLSDDELRLLLTCCPDGIVLKSCSIRCRTAGEQTSTTLDALETVEAFPTVKISDHILSREYNPTADWDVLDGEA